MEEQLNTKYNGYMKPVPTEDPIPDGRPVLLFAMIEAPTFSSKSMIQAFEDVGYNVETFDWQKIKLLEGKAGMAERLIMKAQLTAPDIIFLHMQNPESIDAYTAKALNDIAFTINYTLDVRKDISWYREIGENISMTVMADGESIAALMDAGLKNVQHLHSSCDYDVYKPLPLKEKKNGIVFIGNNLKGTSLDFPQAEERFRMVERLKKEFGDYFRVYGAGWKELDDKAEHVNIQEEVLLYNQCRVAISHNNFMRTRYSSDRIWRAMGCGAAVVSSFYLNINMDFNPAALRVWLPRKDDHFDMLISEISYLLDNPEHCEAQGKYAATFVREHHSWRNRFQMLKTLIDEYRNTASKN